MFGPTSPVPGALIVRAWSGPEGVVVSWPEGAVRPAALSAAVERFCRGLRGGDGFGAPVRPDLPERHPHRHEMGDPTPPVPGPDPWSELRYVELQVTDGLPNLGLREPTAAERAQGAAIEADPEPGPMIVHAFALAPELIEDIPGQPAGPGRPWAEFRQAIIDEAVRRRPPSPS